MNYQCVWVLACVAGLTMPHDDDRSFSYNAIGDLFFVTTIYFTLSGISAQLDSYGSYADQCPCPCPNP